MADESGEQGTIKRGRRTSIPCPKCGGRKSRSNGYLTHGERHVRRGRTCANCGARFVTCEIPVEDFKKLRRVEDLDTERARLNALRREEWARINAAHEKNKALADGFMLIYGDIERDRQWQRENPTEALKSILPAPVFEYLNDWARRKSKSLIELVAERMTIDAEIDIDCSRGERPGYILDEWQKKLSPHTVAYK